MQICVWQSLCQGKPQYLRLSRMSMLLHDFLQNREVWPVNICLNPSALQPYWTPHFMLFLPCTRTECLLGLENCFLLLLSETSFLSLWPNFICLSDFQVDITSLTRADLLWLMYLCGMSHNVSWHLPSIGSSRLYGSAQLQLINLFFSPIRMWAHWELHLLYILSIFRLKISHIAGA